MGNMLWRARKRCVLLFGLPISFTVYSLDEDSLNTERGFLNKTYEEIKLYRIRDFTIRASLFQRMFGLGTIHVCSADSSSPEYDIMNIKDVMKIKELISDQVELAKAKYGVKSTEFISDRPERINY